MQVSVSRSRPHGPSSKPAGRQPAGFFQDVLCREQPSDVGILPQIAQLTPRTVQESFAFDGDLAHPSLRHLARAGDCIAANARVSASSSKEGVCDATLSVARRRVPAEVAEGARAQKEDMRPHFQATLQQCHGLAEERGASTATSRFTALPASSVSRGDL